MTEKEFWKLLGGRELIEMMLDAKNFRFYNKSGRYKFLTHSGHFDMENYKICISYYAQHKFHFYTMTILPVGRKTPPEGNRLYCGEPKLLRLFLESRCKVTLTF